MNFIRPENLPCAQRLKKPGDQHGAEKVDWFWVGGKT